MLAWTKILSYVIVQIKTRFCGRGLSPSVSALKRVSVVHMGVPLIPYAHFTQEEEVTLTFTSCFRNWATLPPLGSPVAVPAVCGSCSACATSPFTLLSFFVSFVIAY